MKAELFIFLKVTLGGLDFRFPTESVALSPLTGFMQCRICVLKSNPPRSHAYGGNFQEEYCFDWL